MYRSNDTLVAGDHALNRGDTNSPDRRPSKRRPHPEKTPRAGSGFTLPVLVICAALWFLLNGGHV